MTPLPKRRWSTARQGKKRASFVVGSKTAGKCSNCGEPTINHVACPNCGFYKGKLIIKPKKVENRT